MDPRRASQMLLVLSLLVVSGCRPAGVAVLPTVSSPGAPASTPVPLSARAISPANASQVERLAQFGKNEVRAMAYSPDGRLLAVASATRTWLHDAESMAELRSLEGGAFSCTYSPWPSSSLVSSPLALSPDGSTLAAVDVDGVTLRRASDGAVVRSLQLEKASLTMVAFSPDGSVLAAGSRGGAVHLWRVADGSLFHTLDGQRGVVLSLAFSPDGTLLAAGTLECAVLLWRVGDGTTLGGPLETSGRVQGLAFSPDGAVLAAAAGAPHLWRVSDRTRLPVVERPDLGQGMAVAFTHEGAVLASAAEGSLSLWRPADGALLQTLPAREGSVVGVAFAPGGGRLAWAIATEVRAWRVADGALLGSLEGYSGEVASLAFAPASDVVAAGSGTVNLWRVADGTLLRTLDGHGGVYCLAYSPDGALLATGSGDGAARLWRAADGALLHTLGGHEGRVVAVRFSSDGARLATASPDGRVRLWGVSDGALMSTLEGLEAHRLNPESSLGPALAALTPGWDTLAWAANDTLHIYRLGEGRRVSVRGDRREVWSVAFSPDGALLASGGVGVVRFWRARDGALLRTGSCRAMRPVSGLAFSPDGTVLASTDRESGLLLWQVSDAVVLRAPSGQPGTTGTVAFSPDGATLASAGPGGTISLWGVEP